MAWNKRLGAHGHALNRRVTIFMAAALVVAIDVLGFNAPASQGAPPAAAEPQEPAESEADKDQTQEREEERKATPPRRRANRLSRETSPYLLLHAHNPVDWHGWGEEALAKAAREKKLIFLSIGYSSCYWCHVMERESFMDEEIAKALNENFICIKVDREERPDIDEIYMTALQVMGRRGGWPLTMFLTPDAKPFFGGTYFPPRDKDAPGVEVKEGEKAPRITGLATLLKLVDEGWRQSPEDIEATAEQVSSAVRRALRRRPLAAVEPPNASLADGVEESFAGQYDEQHGGFGYSSVNPSQPKFPEPQNLLFLIDRIDRAGSDRAREMLVGTLDAMASGGIRDHLGGGFHRYSTDRYWRIPHFEKMLYDNGQLATVYAEAFRITGRAEYRQVTEEILAFVDRELTSPEGAFYAALDAETDAEEGRYYVWTEEELSQALAPDAFDLLADAYGVKAGPNFDGRSVLQPPRPLKDVAAARRMAPADFEQSLAAARQVLLELRNERPRPLTDTKILASWNGLMIRGYADAGRIFERPEHVQSAARAAGVILDHLQTDDGRLLHAYTAGKAALNAYVDDYAFLVDGLIALHRATGESRWLEAADALTQKQLELFWDAEGGGFFFTSHDHEALLARSKDPIDSVIPSGNAVSIGNLVYLAKAADKPEYLDRAEEIITAFSPWLAQSPTGLPRTIVGWTALREAQPPKDAPPQ